MAAEILGLRSWRIRKGVSLDAISASTKLRVSQLEAIECGDFAKLPGGIYNTSYLRQYAAAIDFDECDLLAFYRQCCGSASEAEPQVAAKPGRGFRLLFQP